MVSQIDELKKDHGRYRKYLSCFEKHTRQFGKGDDASLDPLKEIAEFFALFPDRRHHRIEDAIYKRMKEEAAGPDLPDMQAEHAELFREAGAFYQAMEQIFLGQQISREAVRDLAADFISRYRAHLEMEEAGFFPSAEALNEMAWRDIGRAVAKIDADPLEPARQARIRDAEEDIGALCN